MGSSPSPVSSTKPTSYDEVLYPGFSFRQSHPDRLATQAMIFGMTPAPVEACRALELGCGDGGNLVPMAFGLPGSEFTGIDLAERPVAKGQSRAHALGLTNLTLRQMDLMDIEPALGEFDSIIAHGVYSWVPPEVQEKVLSICSKHLAPHGVAYVSYNAYPGSHMREMLRRMMLYESRGVEDPRERVTRGIELIERLVQSLEKTDAFRCLIEPELRRMREIGPASLFHDDFNEFYTPVYFYELIERARRHGLQYLAEAALSAMHVTQVELFGQSSLAGLDVVAGEQMLDFRTFRSFRATLLCHQELNLDRTLKPERVRPLYVSSSVRPESAAPDIASRKEETFRAAERKVGLKVSTNHPLTKAALSLLGARWPDRLAFTELEAAALELSRWAPQDHAEPPLEAMVLRMCGSEMVELHAHRPALSERAGDRPVSSALARLLLSEGNYVTNLRHEGLDVDDKLRRLILLLDGTRDRAALLEAMESTARTDVVGEKRHDGPQDHGAPQMAPLEELEQNLQKIPRMALLVA